jgi:2-oxoisovalerate dehydrogenase E2 component (dihydrolipoyl transacylase)
MFDLPCIPTAFVVNRIDGRATDWEPRRAADRPSSCRRLDPIAEMGDTTQESNDGPAADRKGANVAKVTMPQLGESVAEGTIGKWLKEIGDHVAKYEPLVEVVTDKVNAEVPSPFEGILREILVEEGTTVPNNAEIAVIETADEGAAEASPAAGATGPVVTSQPAAVVAPPAASAPAAEPTPAVAASAAEPTPAVAAGPAGSDERGSSEVAAAASSAPVAASSAAPPADADPDARMTPAVRRLLREHELTAAQIVGTGGGGRITREDVLKVVEEIRTGSVAPAPAAGAAAPAPARSGASGQNGSGTLGTTAAPRASTPSAPPAAPIEFPAGADEVLVPLTKMRKGIAAQMTRALAVPHAYVHMEVDATALVRAREMAKRDYQAREGVSLSYVPFVIKAAVDAFRRYPSFNAHWTENGLLAKRRVHMGVAVAVDDGLIVPVVRDVDQLSISGLNRAIAEVAARARAGKLRLEDYGGSTFTIDNTGWFGSNLTMPIINVPEVAILTMEAITKRAVVLETPEGDVIAIRPVMNMVLAIDHRANDGAQAAAFLRTIKTWLEAIGQETPIF